MCVRACSAAAEDYIIMVYTLYYVIWRFVYYYLLYTYIYMAWAQTNLKWQYRRRVCAQ